EILIETKKSDDKDEFIEEKILEVKDRNFNDKILSDYKELWIKHFKISEDFKINFPFEKIYNLLKFGVTPELYIKEALNASSEYFKWKKTEIYINQEDKFVDCVSKNFLNDEIIDIPVKGDKKGRSFIPLYPYNQNTIFGYLSFEWNETDNFMIADVLYFLKFLFSEDAKNIFLNYRENENIILEFKNLFAKKKCFFCLIEVDNKEELKMKMKKRQSDNINLMIYDNFKNDFKNCDVYSIFKFYYCVFGEYEDINLTINFIEDCVTDYDKHNYKISVEEGNSAVTFSAGLSYKSQDDDTSDSLINQALNNLKIAIIQGGNQIVSE
nr:hypothetical protein [Spirochaetota bacterium]